jgi:taurine dioxygenase
MKSRKVADNFGLEFFDVDLSEITEQELITVQQAQNLHGVVFFRDQDLDCDQHIQFAKRFGKVVVNRFFEKVDGYDEIAMVRKEPHHGTVVGENWHTDHSYDQAPALGSILYAREVPSVGGDTLFVNTYLAYEALSDGLKFTLENLNAVHGSDHVFSKTAVRGIEPNEDRFHNFDQAIQENVHPVVIVHPNSGRKSLYINPLFTLGFEGWTREESAPLLNYLCEHSLKSEFQLRYRWHTDSIAFWDNRATWHQAQNDYPTERRIMHRITLEGCELEGIGGC